MRVTSLVLACLLMVPAVSAEFGAKDAHGWPLDANGKSTMPQPLNEVAGVTIFPYYPLLTAEVERLASEYPDLVHVRSIGQSTLGLELWLLEIANFQDEGKPGFVPLDSRERIWVDGGHHSTEYSGVYFTLHLAQWLLEDYGRNDTATWMVDNRHVFIVPLVNPDGAQAMGRLNANLVNLNRNYPVLWGQVDEDPIMNNRGPAPESEVETQALVKALNDTQPDYYASLHCCGNLWLYPYGIEGMDPVDQTMLSRVCDEAFPDVREYCGPIWSTIYPASGSSVDTVYEYTGAVAFGYEMSGRGAAALWGQPFTTDDIEIQEYESWQGLMHALLNVHLYGAFPVIENVAGIPGGIQVTIRNDGYGNLTAGWLHAGDPWGPRTVLPRINTGERVTVDAPSHLVQGETSVAIGYDKRLEDSTRQGIVFLPLRVTEDGSGEAPAGGYVVAKTAEAPIAPVPMLGLVWVLAGLAAVAWIRKRGT